MINQLLSNPHTCDRAEAILQQVQSGQLTPELGLDKLQKLSQGTAEYKNFYAFEQVWQKKDIAENSIKLSGNDCIVLFTDNTAHKEKLQKITSANVVIVKFSGTDDKAHHIFSVGADAEKNYNDLFAFLKNYTKIYFVHIGSFKTFDANQNKLDTLFKKSLHHIFDLSKSAISMPQLALAGFYVFYQTEGLFEQPQYQANAAFLKSLQKEKTHLQIKCIGLDQSDNLASILLNEMAHPDAVEVIYQKSQRFSRVTQRFAPAYHLDNAQKLKSGGVYLITGGLGGLGKVFARAFVQQTSIKLVLLGRSPLDARANTILEELQTAALPGCSLEYHSVDISYADSVKNIIHKITQNHGSLDGIVHAAGLLRDGLLINKSMDDLQAVMAPKVSGTVNLDVATANLTLDFFVCFSSLSGVIGNNGQTDYAYANAFMDHFMAWRQNQVASGQRSGKSLSINWPLWREGGMQVNAQVERWIQDNLGLDILDTPTGLHAFNVGLQLPAEQTQLIALMGRLAKINDVLGADAAVIEHQEQKMLVDRQQNQTDGNSLPLDEQIVLRDLTQLAADLLKVGFEEIDPDDDLSDYGFDSIGFTELANAINQQYQTNLTPAVFFEHPSCQRLTAYFMANCTDELALFYAANSPAQSSRPAVKTTSVATAQVNSAKNKPTTTRKARARFMPTSRAAMQQNAMQPIAIIGMSGVMPESADLDAFWQHLQAGDDLIREVPEERWCWQDYYGDPEKEARKTYAKWGGFIPDADKFDALFFDISPREAALMDPQQRVLLQTVWHCIENAGYRASGLAGSDTGVFIGIGGDDYSGLLKQHIADYEAHMSTGVAHSVAANRISYLLNLHGPSEPIDTACSSSLVAIHRAVQAIRHGECQLAIAGASNIITSPTMTLSFSKAGMLSPDGRCKTFAADANGYVRSEGSGAVLLKSLDQAEADGDHIHAVILNSAQNHGGKAASLTAPNPNAQADLLVQAYTQANIDPASISYIEAHGTGTPLGDPIEVNGLKQAFARLYQQQGQSLPQEKHCAIGAVKSQVGHLETVAGFAGLFKTVMAMQHEYLPANLHSQAINPYIDVDQSPFYFAHQAQPWTPMYDAQGKALLRRAGISSFGFGGSNAHVIIQEYVQPQANSLAPKDVLIVLSAKTDQALQDQIQALHDYLAQQQPPLASIAYTLQVGREAFKHRLALLTSSLDDLRAQLSDVLQGGSTASYYQNDQTDTVSSQQQALNETLLEDATKNRQWRVLANLWVNGADVDWSACYADQPIQRVPLPGYPFAKVRHWFKSTAKTDANASQIPGVAAELSPLLDKVEYADSLLSNKLVFSKLLNPQDWIVQQHQVQQSPVLPGVAYLEVAATAARQLYPSGALCLCDVAWLQPMHVDEPTSFTLALQHDVATGDIVWLVESAAQGKAIKHAQGKACLAANTDFPAIDIDAIQQRCELQVDMESIYTAFHATGIHYGPCFRSLKELCGNENEAMAYLQLPQMAETAEFSSYLLAPPLMDGALQTIMGIDGMGEQMLLPFAVESITVQGSCGENVYVYVKRLRDLHFDLYICNEQGQVCLYWHELAFRALNQPLVTAQPPKATPANLASVTRSQSESTTSTKYPLGQLLQHITDVMAEVLQIDANQLDSDSPYTDFGVDSILAVELVNRLNEQLNLQLRATELFNYPNITELATFIQQEMPVPDMPEESSIPQQPSQNASDVDDLTDIINQLQQGKLDLDNAEQALQRIL